MLWHSRLTNGVEITVAIVIEIFVVHATWEDPEVSSAEIVAARVLCVNCRHGTNVSDYSHFRILL